MDFNQGNVNGLIKKVNTVDHMKIIENVGMSIGRHQSIGNITLKTINIVTSS